MTEEEQIKSLYRDLQVLLVGQPIDVVTTALLDTICTAMCIIASTPAGAKRKLRLLIGYGEPFIDDNFELVKSLAPVHNTAPGRG